MNPADGGGAYTSGGSRGTGGEKRLFGLEANYLPSGQVLDRARAQENMNTTRYELAEILATMGLAATMKSFDALAADLSRLAGRKTAWTKKYVHSVFKGTIAPSAEFARAVEKLAQTTDGTPAGVAGSAMVRVLADPVKIPEGVLIPANALVVKCARPGCPVWFVRVHPRQKYHDPECGRRK